MGNSVIGPGRMRETDRVRGADCDTRTPPEFTGFGIRPAERSFILAKPGMSERGFSSTSVRAVLIPKLRRRPTALPAMGRWRRSSAIPRSSILHATGRRATRPQAAMEGGSKEIRKDMKGGSQHGRQRH